MDSILPTISEKPKKSCPNCKKEVEGRKKYCSDGCLYWFNVLKKDAEKHLAPVRKRNKDWFYCYMGVGYVRGGMGRGRGTNRGGMADIFIPLMLDELRPSTVENMRTHFDKVHYARYGDGSYIYKSEFEKLNKIE